MSGDMKKETCVGGVCYLEAFWVSSSKVPPVLRGVVFVDGGEESVLRGENDGTDQHRLRRQLPGRAVVSLLHPAV